MKYPTRRSGLAVPPCELGFAVPSPEQLETRGLTSVHHFHFPRTRFTDPIGSVFRSLETNTTRMLAIEHNIGARSLHAIYREGVSRPSTGVMIDTVDEYLERHGFIVCVKENQTRVHYKITEKEWRHKVKTYRSKDGRI